MGGEIRRASRRPAHAERLPSPWVRDPPPPLESSRGDRSPHSHACNLAPPSWQRAAGGPVLWYFDIRIVRSFVRSFAAFPRRRRCVAVSGWCAAPRSPRQSQAVPGPSSHVARLSRQAAPRTPPAPRDPHSARTPPHRVVDAARQTQQPPGAGAGPWSTSLKFHFANGAVRPPARRFGSRTIYRTSFWPRIGHPNLAGLGG